MTAWSNLYQVLESIAKVRFPNRNVRGAKVIIPELITDGYLDAKTVDEIHQLRMVRNDVVHGNIKELRKEMIDRLNELTKQLQQKLGKTPAQ